MRRAFDEGGSGGSIRGRVSGIPLIAILALGFTSVLLVSSPSSIHVAHAESLGSWTATTNYPTSIVSPSCVASGGYVYCVEGRLNGLAPPTNATYYAPVSSSGVGAWTATYVSYPSSKYDSNPSFCATYGGYIYYVGGITASDIAVTSGSVRISQNDTAVYYAPVSSTGLGGWVNTTDYPSTPSSCVADQGYIYCLGGGGVWYYAPLSPTGVGAWTAATSYYPQTQTIPSCAASGDYIYCVGGPVYYAPILSSGGGLGAWTSTTGYPLTSVTGQSCAISGSYLYCVGGSDPEMNAGSGYPLDVAYYAQILSPSQGGGVSAWTLTSNYPIGYPVGIEDESCVSSGASVYCVGGLVYYRIDGVLTSSVYYTSISSQPASTSQLTVDTRTTGSIMGASLGGYYILLYDQSGDLVSTGFSPATFTVDSGQMYTVQVDDYGSCHVAGWVGTGSTFSASRTIAIAGNVSITALYGCYGDTSGLTVNSIDQNGRAIFGYYAGLYSTNGTVLAAGFTTNTFGGLPYPPLTFIAGQTYEVQADSYGPCTFSHWSDGVTSDPRSFTATGNETAFTAVYDCRGGGASSATVDSVDQNGNPISGYYAVLYDSSGNAVANGFTPAALPTPAAGQPYSVQAESYGDCTFSHWSDGVTSDPRSFVSSSGVSFTAVYDCAAGTT